MSDWTGVLYGFYTNKPIDIIFNRLKEKLIEIGYTSNYEKYADEESLLFYKNDEMLKYHLEHGYNTDINNEGCFGVEAKIVNLQGIASLFEFDGDSDFEPYDINLQFSNIFYYVLVIPNLIEDSIFSCKIHKLFIDVIQKC